MRRAWLGLLTVLGLARRGFFIPHRHADAVPPAGQRGRYDAIAQRFDAARGDFLSVIDAIDAVADDLRRIGGEPPPQPRWTQDWFPGLDAAAAYALVRRERPARIIEVGSGHSTRFLLRAIRDGGFSCAVTCIDPAPRADIAALPVTAIRQTLQQAGLAPFAALQAGDVLFIDSSHILMPGSDVDLLLNKVIPALPAGVWIHVHDIFLPEDYPMSWDWRGYNEQQGFAALITGGFAPVFASAHARATLAERLGRSVMTDITVPEGAFEASLWLKKPA